MTTGRPSPTSATFFETSLARCGVDARVEEFYYPSGRLDATDLWAG
jgi:hypothetical protein